MKALPSEEMSKILHYDNLSTNLSFGQNTLLNYAIRDYDNLIINLLSRRRDPLTRTFKKKNEKNLKDRQKFVDMFLYLWIGNVSKFMEFHYHLIVHQKLLN
jgi:hypothetical protein